MTTDLARTTAKLTYENVSFPAQEVKTSWGHDSARHQGYGQRGADVEDTGEKPFVVSVKIPLRNGLRWDGERLYPETYLKLREALKTPEGFLTHPTYGLLTVHVDSVDEGILGEKGDGLDLDVSFTVQRGESQDLSLSLGTATLSPDAAALVAAADADTAAAGLTLATTTSLADTIGTAFDALQETERTYLEASTAFDALTSDLAARALDAGAADATGHAYRAAVARCLSATLAYRAEYLGTSGPETVTLPEEMSLARASVLAYGDASRAAELATKNRVSDPSFIPAGTVLVI